MYVADYVLCTIRNFAHCRTLYGIGCKQTVDSEFWVSVENLGVITIKLDTFNRMGKSGELSRK